MIKASIYSKPKTSFLFGCLFQQTTDVYQILTRLIFIVFSGTTGAEHTMLRVISMPTETSFYCLNYGD